jgi:hypothetical protein
MPPGPDFIEGPLWICIGRLYVKLESMHTPAVACACSQYLVFNCAEHLMWNAGSIDVPGCHDAFRWPGTCELHQSHCAPKCTRWKACIA